jgi:hypothetical protein
VAIKSIQQVKVGDLYTVDGKDVWRVEACCEQPTVVLVNVETKERKQGIVGGSELEDIVRLIPEAELQGLETLEEL